MNKDQQLYSDTAIFSSPKYGFVTDTLSLISDQDWSVKLSLLCHFSEMALQDQIENKDYIESRHERGEARKASGEKGQSAVK